MWNRIKQGYHLDKNGPPGPLYLYTDNVEADINIMMGPNGIFSATLNGVLADPFHLILNYGSQVSRSPRHAELRRMFIRSVSNILFRKGRRAPLVYLAVSF
jgi:hypothetical protein